MSITITIEGHDAAHARREMSALLGEPEQAVFWLKTEKPSARTVAKEVVTAGEVVDALHGALKAETATEDTEGVEFPAATSEPPKKRGRPRKEAPVAEEPVVLEGEALPADSGKIDIEDVIAAANEQDSAQEAASGADEQETAPQPEDPSTGWTTQDARNAGRALLDRAPDVDTGNRKLAATLVPFGVQQVKALQPDQIEAFVAATQKAVF